MEITIKIKDILANEELRELFKEAVKEQVEESIQEYLPNQDAIWRIAEERVQRMPMERIVAKIETKVCDLFDNNKLLFGKYADWNMCQVGIKKHIEAKLEQNSKLIYDTAINKAVELVSEDLRDSIKKSIKL